ncbi:MAG: COX15/CtaA family protein [Pseudomonadales bacterium]|nr:COX15/CtaA family protein [Pseudomonadales bacterium]
MLTFFIVVLGAFVRLSDAGLGCPDWPGCYGHLGVPDSHSELQIANEAYPERPVEAHKAWKEMIHRYFASSLGLIIIVLAGMAIRKRLQGERKQQLLLPLLLVLIVCFQGALGMWTVTLLVKPVIVTLHLLFGLITLSLLFLMALRHYDSFPRQKPPHARPKTGFRAMALAGLIIVFTQIFLGGWTSTNYAALHCPDLPTCQGQWFPETDFKEAFTLIREIGVDYEGGVLDNTGRVTVHVTHRLGAVVTLIFVTLLGILALKEASPAVRKSGIAMLILVSVQFCLGIANVLLHLPIAIAVAHNGGAALLLLSLVAINHFSKEPAVQD